MASTVQQVVLAMPRRQWLVLALATPAHDRTPHETLRVGQPQFGPGRRVLLVDDEPDLLELTKALLEDALPGVKVHTAATGAEGLLLVGQRQYDAVVSDYRMPAMDGLEFLLKAAHTLPQDRRILMTAYANAGLQQRAQQAGMAFLEKGGDPQNIVDAVRRALGLH